MDVPLRSTTKRISYLKKSLSDSLQNTLSLLNNIVSLSKVHQITTSAVNSFAGQAVNMEKKIVVVDEVLIKQLSRLKQFIISIRGVNLIFSRSISYSTL